MKKIFQLHIVLFLISISIIESKGSEQKFILFPEAYKSLEFNYSLGLSMTIIPRAIVEEELRQVPVLDMNARLGLPLNFSINSRLSTIVIANEASIGAMWTIFSKILNLSLGYDYTYWYGFADIDGFDVKAGGIIHSPYISYGLHIDETYLTIKGELIFLAIQETTIGGTYTRNSKNEFNGYAITIGLEQFFWGETNLLIAAKLNYAKSLYQSWLAFSTFDKIRLYPEVIVGVIF